MSTEHHQAPARGQRPQATAGAVRWILASTRDIIAPLLLASVLACLTRLVALAIYYVAGLGLIRASGLVLALPGSAAGYGVLAGWLIAGPGLPVCYGLDAACFAAFGLALMFVRPLPPVAGAPRPGLRSLAEGVRYVRRSGVLGGMLSATLLGLLFVPLFFVLMRERFTSTPRETSS